MMRWLLVFSLLAAPLARAAPVTIYLHGKFVEEHGPQDVHPQHGPYRYDAILQALARDGAEVVSEKRARDTDVSAYADRVVADLRARLAAGTPARELAVVGASKGGVIAALVSSRLDNDEVRYVLMGACNDWLERTHHPRLHGRVLAIFDAADDVAGSCGPLAAARPPARFREIELHTGRGHGFLYTPDAWIEPVLAFLRES